MQVGAGATTTGPTLRFLAVSIGPRRRRYPAPVGAERSLLWLSPWNSRLVALGVVVAGLASGRFITATRSGCCQRSCWAGPPRRGAGPPRPAAAGCRRRGLGGHVARHILAGGRARNLRRAAGLVGALEENPWRAHVASARLGSGRGRADIRSGPRPRAVAPQCRSPGRVAVWGGLAILLLALSRGGAMWRLPPLRGPRRPHVRPQRPPRVPSLAQAPCRRGNQLRADGGLWGEDESPVLDLILLSGGDRRGLRHALVWSRMTRAR